jgi:hypothetical protein
MNLLPTHPLDNMATRDDLNSLAGALRCEMPLGVEADQPPWRLW